MLTSHEQQQAEAKAVREAIIESYEYNKNRRDYDQKQEDSMYTYGSFDLDKLERIVTAAIETIAMMTANKERELKGEVLAYDETCFDAVLEEMKSEDQPQ